MRKLTRIEPRASTRTRWWPASHCAIVTYHGPALALSGPNLEPGRIHMRRLLFLFVTLALAGACIMSSGPGTPPPRATLNFVRQDSTYKPLLSAQGTFYAKVGEARRVRLVYQGSTPADSGAEFLRFEVPGDGLYRKPDGTAFAPGDSIQITVTVIDPTLFRLDFQPSRLQFNPSDPARLRQGDHYADPAFNGDGRIDSGDADIEAVLSLGRRVSPESLCVHIAAGLAAEVAR